MTFCVKYRKLSTIETNTVLLTGDDQSLHHHQKHCPKMTTKTNKKKSEDYKSSFWVSFTLIWITL